MNATLIPSLPLPSPFDAFETQSRVALASSGHPVDFHEFFAKTFTDSHLNPISSTDQRKALYADLAAKEKILIEHGERLKAYRVALSHAMESLVDVTIDTLLTHSDVKFADSLGCNLRLQTNSQPKLELDETAVPPKYYTEKTTCVIDRERIKCDLLDGKELGDWAQLIRGVHLKGLK